MTPDEAAAKGLCTVCQGRKQIKIINMTWTYWIWPHKWIMCNWCFGTGKLNPEND